MYIDSDVSRLVFFSRLYEDAKNHLTEVRERMERWEAQYRGDRGIDGSSEAASAVRNITYELIESQVSSDIPAPRVTARSYSEERERLAHAVERLCTSVRDELPFEEMNDMDERYTYILGGSVWLVEWDGGIVRDGTVGGVRVSCISPLDFFPQPGLYRVEDMEYCFLRFDTTREELIRRYGVSREIASDAESERVGVGNDDTVTAVVCYYRGADDEICRFVFSGEAVLEDQEGYFRRRTEDGGFQNYEELTRDVPLSDGGRLCPVTPILEGEGLRAAATRLPYYVLREFPIVIRRNTSADRSLFGQSDCEFIRPEQQQINKVESRIMQKLMRSAVTPIVPEDAQISVTNSVFGQVIRLRPGESAAQYGKVDTTPDISQDILQAERLYDHAKRIVGISDSFQGMDEMSAHVSGYARQLQLSQAAGRLESKRRMKNAAYAAIDRLIFLSYLAYADEPRELGYRDSFGRAQELAFNRYDFYALDGESGEYRIDDGFLFSADLSAGLETGREALWEKNLENLRAGAMGDPTSEVTLLRYWQQQERAHYPFAQDQVEYFRGRVGVAEEEGESVL